MKSFVPQIMLQLGVFLSFHQLVVKGPFILASHHRATSLCAAVFRSPARNRWWNLADEEVRNGALPGGLVLDPAAIPRGMYEEIGEVGWDLMIVMRSIVQGGAREVGLGCRGDGVLEADGELRIQGVAMMRTMRGFLGHLPIFSPGLTVQDGRALPR